MRPMPLLLIAAALALAGCGHHTSAAAPAAQPEQVGAPAIAPATIPSAKG